MTGKDTLILFTCPVSTGNSGGPLLSEDGKVIGIVVAQLTEGQNLNFAISIKAVKDLYDQWNKYDYEILGTENVRIESNGILCIVSR